MIRQHRLLRNWKNFKSRILQDEFFKMVDINKNLACIIFLDCKIKVLIRSFEKKENYGR